MVQRVTFLALTASLVFASMSCKHDAPPAPHAATESPIPAPANLTAEGTLRDPDAFWGRLRKGGGEGLARFPDTAAGLILDRVGADPSLAQLVAGSKPFHIALGGDSPDGVTFAIAMKLGDTQAVRTTLVESETSHYRGEDIAGMIHLVAREGPAPRLAVAVTWSGYLVVASSVAELETLGAYATRTLPTQALPSSSFQLRLDAAALGRTAKKAADSALGITAILAATARSMLPAEVDSTALAACFTPGIRDTIASAGDLSDARIEADADDAQLDVSATLVPKPGDNGALKRLTAMHPGSAAPLLDAPRDAIATFFWSDSADARAEDANTLGPCLGRALTGILGPQGGARFAGLLAAWAHARGDWETASFVAKGPEAGFVVRAPVADRAAASTTVRGFVDLASQPSVADAIAGLLPLRAGSVESFDAPHVGNAQVVMFPPHPAFSRGLPGASAITPDLAPPGFAWAVDDKEVDIGLGQSPKDLLGLTRPVTPLKTKPSVDHTLAALGAETSFAGVIALPGCCAGDGPASGPLKLTWGRHAGSGRAHLAIGDELLAQIASRMAGP